MFVQFSHVIGRVEDRHGLDIQRGHINAWGPNVTLAKHVRGGHVFESYADATPLYRTANIGLLSTESCRIDDQAVDPPWLEIRGQASELLICFCLFRKRSTCGGHWCFTGGERVPPTNNRGI